MKPWSVVRMIFDALAKPMRHLVFEEMPRARVIAIGIIVVVGLLRWPTEAMLGY